MGLHTFLSKRGFHWYLMKVKICRRMSEIGLRLCTTACEMGVAWEMSSQYSLISHKLR